MAEEISVKPSQAKEAIRSCIAAQQPCHLWGSPGIGKSQIIKQVCVELSLEVKDVRAVLLDPVDLRGLPHVNGDNRAHWAVPDFLPREGSGVLFLDELNRAPQLVQNACFQLVLDRKIGEYALPDGWTVLAAGNRESDGGGITRMNSALTNRFIHLALEVDLDEWCSWAAASLIDPMLIAFMRWRPALLHNFDRNAHAFPTPRSWEFVNKIMQQPMSQDIEMALVSGAVGKGAAVEFEAFVRLYRNLPNIDGIFLDPAGSQVPTDPATLFAVTAALAARTTESNFGRVITYLDRVSPEYAVFAMKDATAREPKLLQTKEFTNWAVTHADLM